MPEEKRLWKGARPRPREFFPYITRVSRTSGLSNLQVQTLFDLFAEYKPTAVGISGGKKYGWVCLPDLEALQNFIESVDGKKAKDGEDEDVWTVISDYDPTVVPAQDWEELRSNQKLELQVEADEKRARRRLKRETKSADFEGVDTNVEVMVSSSLINDLQGEEQHMDNVLQDMEIEASHLNIELPR
ncbi:hypothetical protein ACHAQJ_005223 [Trichoderma viride]